MIGTHGWKTHTDRGALEWASNKISKLMNEEEIHFLDIGCGYMGMVDMAMERFSAYGIDADVDLLNRVELKNKDRLYLSDFNKTFLSIPICFEILWSVEVGEHINPDSVDNYIKTIANAMAPRMKIHPYHYASILIFSAAPVTGNVKHCNEQPIKYWIDKFADYNVVIDEEMTKELRAASTMDRNFIRSNGFVFIKKD